jgi:NDP-sugar pyrophosphorylase family protein
MQVMILAAGRSTRLGALGAARPKPLVPICGYPAITYGLALCARAGLRDVVVNVHHHGDQIQEAIGDGARYGVNVRYSVEGDLLGTGGGLAHARRLFRSEPVLVLNGKVVADLDLGAVVAAHRSAPPGTLATMVLRDDPHPELWAPIAVDATGRVVGLRGERGPVTVVGDLVDRMFTGVHVVEGALLDRLPAGVSDVIGEAYLPALHEGGNIRSYTMTGYFAEHSTPDRYLAGNLALVERPGLVPQAPGPLVGVDEGAEVAAGATIVPPVRIAAGAVVEAGATVGPRAVVDRGGRVAGGALVEEAVVWEGAVARGTVRRAVVTEAGVVAAEAPGAAGGR